MHLAKAITIVLSVAGAAVAVAVPEEPTTTCHGQKLAIRETPAAPSTSCTGGMKLVKKETPTTSCHGMKKIKARETPAPEPTTSCHGMKKLKPRDTTLTKSCTGMRKLAVRETPASEASSVETDKPVAMPSKPWGKWPKWKQVDGKEAPRPVRKRPEGAVPPRPTISKLP
ncbi:hypothetical protein H072_3337 [Dactylellina haptotyla CBS 200.50]|uniref:Uncharacterized protein n=1 Tax=Dactylellina haptotyla (strain CBS 200.50) TaxID=1284197 RepID=S8ANK3_DACHA|nr:hypothetical protein H072_3337 [Dactylellina haptotyla CBS 200.50]